MTEGRKPLERIASTWAALNRRSSLPAYVGIATVSLLIAVTLLYQFPQTLPFRLSSEGQVTGSHHGPYTTFVHLGSHYRGLTEIDTYFVFGDSFTSTGFEETGDQPSLPNPFGNPTFPGATATNGPNWVGYLTATHNITFVKTVNFAYGGSTIDLELLHPDVPALRDFKYQINEQYLLNYVLPETTKLAWMPENTLHIIWMGLNDVHNANNQTASLFGRVYEEFAKDVEQLYTSGARNFLFLNLPPIERCPLAFRIYTANEWKSWVAAWNTNLTSLASTFTQSHPDATAIVFDTFKVWNEMIDNPCTFEQSCRFEDVSTFCNYYAFGAPTWNYTDPHCELSIDKYLWMNDIHPTTPVFNITAQEIVRTLQSIGSS